ncbi:MAG: hypothetical protein Q4D27_03865 [Coriobacteriia bacterium]|nr:hypothetical protein [Coriobacteriia bacterium]
MEMVNRVMADACGRVHGRVAAKLAQTRGQGTTEYAILVGVLVVIAILAITLIRPRIQELWDAIAAGINGL